MSTIPPRQRATLARRIAAGLPVWAAARGSNLPEDEVSELMWEGRFRELIGSFAEILEMDAEARKRRLLKLAHQVVEMKLCDGDVKTAFFVQREYKRNRDPIVTLAKGFSQTLGTEKTRADRQRELMETVSPVPVEPASELESAASPLSGAIAEAEAAGKLRGTVDPDDAAMWRKAGQLRHSMQDEQVLHHAVTRKTDLDRRMGPPDIVHEPEAVEQQEVQEPLFSSVQQEVELSPTAPVPSDLTDENEETENAFTARATALFNETLSQAPPHLRELLATFSPKELWALAGVDDPSSENQPQAP